MRTTYRAGDRALHDMLARNGRSALTYLAGDFATVRYRTCRTKGCGSRAACLTMVLKLVQCAERHWRASNASKFIPKVLAGVQFVDGTRKLAA